MILKSYTVTVEIDDDLVVLASEAEAHALIDALPTASKLVEVYAVEVEANRGIWPPAFGIRAALRMTIEDGVGNVASRPI